LQDLIFNTHDIILLATIYQSILFALLILIVKRDKHKSDIFLIGFLITQAAIPLHLLINYGDGFRLIALEFSPNIFRLFEIAYWLEGPLMLWYTRTLVYRHYKWSSIDWLFLAPALIYFIFMVVNFYSLDPLVKYVTMRDYQTEESSIWRHLSGFTRESLRVVFSIMCLIDIRHCRQQIRNRYSNVDKIDLGWLNFLVVAFLVVRIWAIFVSFALILSAHLNVNIDFSSMGLIGNYTTFTLVSGLIFFSLMRSSLFEGIESAEEVELQKVEHEQSEIDPAVTRKIEDYMKSSKPFLANILTLDQLAKQLDMPSRALSNTINRHFKQNFFEFINQYRVEEAKVILTDPSQKNKTMIDVMADCGFNSKATFNTFFKKLVGLTPSQYRADQFAKD
jgi:AraC-like DNA-binding protein